MKKSSSSGQSKLQPSSGASAGKAAQEVAPSASKPPPRRGSETGGPASGALREARSSRSEARSVEFNYTNPSAGEVFLVGVFNHWHPGATPMRKQGAGRWWAELQLKPGDYEYRLVVDGEWREDPAASRSVPNPFGGSNSVKVVSPVGASAMPA